LFFVLPTILASVVFPLTAGGNKDTVKELLSLISRSVLWLYFLVCLFLIMFGNRLFLFLFGNTFVKMYQSFLFLIPGILSLSMLYTLTAFYAGKNRMEVNIKGALFALLFVITGDYFLIPIYGINAASLVSSVGYFVYLMYVLTIFIKEYNGSVKAFFMMKNADFKTLYNTILKKGMPNNDNR